MTGFILPEITVRTTRSCTLKLDRATLLAMLAQDVPADARITFTVPRGGDYSGDRLNVDADNPITVSWVVVE